MEPSLTSQIKEAQTTLETIQEISRLLNTGLSPEALTVCVRLCEVGVNPEVLSSLVRDFQREVKEYQRPKNARNTGNQN
ncbi:unnamed protein product [Ceutorhynchus assimilis]|uniref:Mitotic-spindle organizing protein 1 n=1 Tax=Ceutorhynchus assimilis TaxID=467358 RepID=A0A9N9MKY3_9CUCU|nr:unnamed protein product [Ceutorhynchus assimilis]